MAQRMCSSLPSTRELTRNATSGGKKSFSFDSTPRIHQGFAAASPDRPTANAAHIATRNRSFICALYSSWVGSGLLRSSNEQQRLLRLPLESAKSGAMISSLEQRVLTTPLFLINATQASGVLSYEDSSPS